MVFKFNVKKTEVLMAWLYRLCLLFALILIGALAVFYARPNIKKEHKSSNTQAVVVFQEKQPEQAKEEKPTAPHHEIVTVFVTPPPARESHSEPVQIIESETPVDEPAQEETKIETKESAAPIVLENKDVIEPVQEEVKEEAVIQDGKKYVAIVIDDMGISAKRSREIISLNAPLTTSFLTYGKNLRDLYKEAFEAGHEIMLHIPMEPKGKASLAPDTLMVDMKNEKIESMLAEMFAKFEGVKIKGANNHMGSLFTENREKLNIVMKALKERHLFFLDSRTTADSVAENVAQEQGVPHISRDIFLDNNNDYQYIIKQLNSTEKTAREKGWAVAIGHPKTETYKALKNWIATINGKDITLVHLSDIVAIQNKKN